MTRLVWWIALAGAACGGQAPDAGSPRGADGPATDPATEIVRGIVVSRDRLGWHDLRMGMTATEVGRVLGTEVSFVGVEPDQLCNYYTVNAVYRGRTLTLDFDRPAADAKLLAITLKLDSAVTRLAAALTAHVPAVQYLPSPHVPELPEAENPSPLYVLPYRAMFLVHPELGIYFGDICVD